MYNLMFWYIFVSTCMYVCICVSVCMYISMKPSPQLRFRTYPHPQKFALARLSSFLFTHPHPPLSLSCHYRWVFIFYNFIEVESNRMHSFSSASFTHMIILRFMGFVAWINSPFLSKLNSIPLCVYTTILPVHLLMNIWAGFGYYK